MFDDDTHLDNLATLTQPASLSMFARSFSQRASRLSWLLGAGASAQSFIPTANQLIDLLLRLLYSSEKNMSVDSIDVGDAHTIRMLRQLYSGQFGLPDCEEPAFYSAIFERTFPNSSNRGAFIESLMGDKQSNYGHHVLAGLAGAGILKLVMTTNFDPLIERAINAFLDGPLSSGPQLDVVDLDNPGRATAALAADRWPLLIKLHGDYRSDYLKNISEELREQDLTLRQAAASALNRFGLVVVGYSGRDDSIMSMLGDVLDLPTPFSAGLFWVKRPQDSLLPAVRDFLDRARRQNVDVAVIEASSFVDLATQLEVATSLPPGVRGWLANKTRLSGRRPEPGPSGPVARAPELQMNALLVQSLPTSARLLRWQKPIGLSEIRQELPRGRDAEAMVGLSNGLPIAFGSDEALTRHLSGLGVTVTDSFKDLTSELARDTPDSQTQGFVQEALVVALGRSARLIPVLRTNREHLLRIGRSDNSNLASLRRACGGSIRGEKRNSKLGLSVPWAEAVSVTLEKRDGNWWLILSPEIWSGRVRADDGIAEPTEAAAEMLDAEVREFIRESDCQETQQADG